MRTSANDAQKKKKGAETNNAPEHILHTAKSKVSLSDADNTLQKLTDNHSRSSSTNNLQSLADIHVQTKLRLGGTDDKFEQEADRVAANVVKGLNTPVTKLGNIALPDVQTKKEGFGSNGLEKEISLRKGSGPGLPASLAASMGQAMQSDFSKVNIHTDSTSDSLNKKLDSNAFTTGNDIFFRSGQYKPSSKDGQQLIAHELAHVVQQGGTSDSVQTKPLSKKKKRKTRGGLKIGRKRSNAVSGGESPMAPAGRSRSNAITGGESPMAPAGRSRSNAITGGESPMAPAGRSRSNAISGGKSPMALEGLARVQGVAEGGRKTSSNLQLDEEESEGNLLLEAADDTVEGLSPVYEAVSDVFDGGSEAGLFDEDGAVPTGLAPAIGLMGLYAAVRQLQSDELDDRIEGAFGIISSTGSLISAGAGIAEAASKEGSDAAKGAQLAAAVGGSVADGIDAIKSLVLTIKVIYDAYKDATSEDGSSNKEKLEAGMEVVKGLLESAASAIAVGKTVLDYLDKASGGVSAAVPGLSIAVSAVDIAINVYNIIKAKSSKAFVDSMLAGNSWQVGGGTFNKGKKGRQERESYITIYKEEIARMKNGLTSLTDTDEIAMRELSIRQAEHQLSSLEENIALTDLSEINSGRVSSAGFDIAVDITKIVGDVLGLVPEPGTQIGSISLKAAAAGAGIAKTAGSKGRQAARDHAAANPDSILNKFVDTTQSSNAKQARQKGTVKYIFNRVMQLPKPGTPKFEQEQTQIERLIEACGMSPNALYREVRSGGVDKALQKLASAQGS